MAKALSFRDRLKPSSTKALKEKMEDEESKIPSSGGNSDFLKLVEGLNKFRAFPPHPGDGVIPGDDSFITLRCSIWLGVEDDEGKMGRRTFQNAKIHAGTKHDIAEEYINLAKAKLSTSKKKDDLLKLTNMTTYKEGNTASIGFNNSWLMYGKMIVKNGDDKRGLLEVKKTIRDAIKSESIIEDEAEAIEVDPFTDPSDGVPMLITYYKRPPKGKKNYQLQLSKNALEMDEEDIEWFEKQKPLSQLSLLKVKLSDYEKILEALRNYDDEFEIGVFESDEFEEKIELCRAELEEALGSDDTDDDDDEKPKKKVAKKKVVEEDEDEDTPVAKKKVAKKVVEEEEEEVVKPKSKKKIGDKFDEMDRDELKAYNKENDLGVVVLKKWEDDELRFALREAEEASEVTEEEEEEEEVKPITKKKVVKKVVEEDEDENENTTDDDDDEKPVAKKKPSLEDLKKKLRTGGK